MFGGAMGFPRQKPPSDVEVELIPVMNLFMTIIPFLLLGVTFYHVAEISAAVPTRSADGTSDVADSASAVTLTLGVSHARGYVLSANGTGVSPEALASLARVLPKRGSAFDTAGLTRTLLAVKKRYPSSDTIVIVPERDILFDDLVKTMDASREVETGASGSNGLASRLALFPRVVLSRLL